MAANGWMIVYILYSNYIVTVCTYRRTIKRRDKYIYYEEEGEGISIRGALSDSYWRLSCYEKLCKLLRDNKKYRLS